jgi:chromosome segregation ATPase
MGLLDDYQNIDETADDGSLAMDPNTARRKRLDLERQIVILDSDLRKNHREIEQYEIQKRRFRKEGERLRIDQEDLDKKLKNLDNDRVSLEDQIRLLKKKLKTLQ